MVIIFGFGLVDVGDVSFRVHIIDIEDVDILISFQMVAGIFILANIRELSQPIKYVQVRETNCELRSSFGRTEDPERIALK